MYKCAAMLNVRHADLDLRDTQHKSSIVSMLVVRRAWLTLYSQPVCEFCRWRTRPGIHKAGLQLCSVHNFDNHDVNPGEPKTCFIFRKKLNCVYNGYYRLTKHKKIIKKIVKDIFRAHVNLYSDWLKCPMGRIWPVNWRASKSV